MIWLMEFAENKKEVERQLTSKTDILIEHILYLIMDKNNKAAQHWKTEIYAFISSVKKLSGKNKFPTKSQIYDWTYGKSEDLVNDSAWLFVLVQDVTEKENFYSPRDIDDIMKRLDGFCKKYFTWLASNLSSVGRVTQSSVIQELNSLITEYSY